MNKRVIAIRHAPTAASGLCVGDSEIPATLSPEEAGARMLSQAGDAAIACVWASPRARCCDPARWIATRLGLSLRIDDRLREISFGAWAQQPWDAIAARDPGLLRSWMEHWLTEAPPGGELPNQLLLRVRSWWDELPQGNHLLISHAGVTRALRVLVRGLSWPEAMASEVTHLQSEPFATE